MKRAIRSAGAKASALFFLFIFLVIATAFAANGQTKFPNSSLTDFSSTLEKPAGKRGFLSVGADGRFRWPDRTRAKFWGINVSSSRLNIPDAQIETVVKGFARAGLNMVRLEAIDNRGCILGDVMSDGSRKLDPVYLDRIDYWIDCLRRNGIYYYLDLLDFRTFKSGDGVINAERLDRAARPYAIFDPYLIQLQKEYAEQLLTHLNPYTNLRPIDDPAMALLEICNEHGFFLYPEKLDNLVEPYRSNLRRLFNAWLRRKYPSRESLKAAWGDSNGIATLTDNEDLAKDTAELPLLSGGSFQSGGTVSDTRRHPKRVADGVAFLSETQASYFREMRQFCRSLGVRIPITAVVSNDVIPDLSSVADTCDFLSENWYGEGIRADAQTPGVKYYSNRHSLRDDERGGFAPYTASLRWKNKPVVIREWGVTWPNRYRVSSIPEALAYSSLQDFDAVLLFGYQTNTAPNGAEADALNDFAFQQDPTVWGLAAICGQAYLSNAISPAKSAINLRYNSSDAFAKILRTGDLHRLSWVTRINSETDKERMDTRKGDTVTPTGDSVRDKAALTALLKTISPNALTLGVWRSDTSQVVRYDLDGRILIQTPRFRAIAGEMNPGKTYELGGGIKFAPANSVCSFVIYSTDGKPLETSRRFVMKVATRAENTDEKLEKAGPTAAGPFALLNTGKGPVLTYGEANPKFPVQVWLPGDGKDPALTVPLRSGTWEAEIRGDSFTFTCDTPGVAEVWRRKR